VRYESVPTPRQQSEEEEEEEAARRRQQQQQQEQQEQEQEQQEQEQRRQQQEDEARAEAEAQAAAQAAAEAEVQADAEAREEDQERESANDAAAASNVEDGSEPANGALDGQVDESTGLLSTAADPAWSPDTAGAAAQHNTAAQALADAGGDNPAFYLVMYVGAVVGSSSIQCQCVLLHT
jgi:membrane protein involved in colicin uptake